MKPGLTGINRIIKASGHSMRGIRAAWIHEAAFRQNSTLSVILLAASFWLAQNVFEWLMLVMPLFLLIIVELLNSAVESAIDRIGPEIHNLSGRAKDMASAAVFFCLILIATVWLSVVWSKFYA